MRIGVSKDWAGYINGELVIVGTCEQVAERLGVSVNTLICMNAPSHKDRHKRSRKTAIRLDTLLCARCGEEIDPNDAYWGNLCKACYESEPPKTLACTRCGTEYKPKGNEKKCPKCIETAINAQENKSKSCGICKSEFPWVYGNERYCSEECRRKAFYRSCMRYYKKRREADGYIYTGKY